MGRFGTSLLPPMGAASVDGSRLRGPGDGGPSTASGVEAVDRIVRHDPMPPDRYASAGNPTPPSPVVAQHRVGVLPAVNGRGSPLGER